jgi:F420-0:gamma-glutamyl ligase
MATGGVGAIVDEVSGAEGVASWHTRTNWVQCDGTPCEVDYVCVMPELAEAAMIALGGTWEALPLGPRVLLVRCVPAAVVGGEVVGDPPG